MFRYDADAWLVVLKLSSSGSSHVHLSVWNISTDSFCPTAKNSLICCFRRDEINHLLWSGQQWQYLIKVLHIKKDLHDQDNHDGVITHLEPDILECEVNWALGSITTNKASAGDGIPFELFQILKDDAVKVLHSICQHIWKTQQWPQDWKRSVFIPISKKGNAKECSDYRTIALISHASKVMLKILQARFQQYMNRELPDVQEGFRKGRGTRDKIANIQWVTEENSRKTSTSGSLSTLKPLIVWITTKCGKLFKKWEYKTILPAPWEICIQIKKQQNWTWNRLAPN